MFSLPQHLLPAFALRLGQDFHRLPFRFFPGCSPFLG